MAAILYKPKLERALRKIRAISPIKQDAKTGFLFHSIFSRCSLAPRPPAATLRVRNIFCRALSPCCVSIVTIFIISQTRRAGWNLLGKRLRDPRRRARGAAHQGIGGARQLFCLPKAGERTVGTLLLCASEVVCPWPPPWGRTSLLLSACRHFLS